MMHWERPHSEAFIEKHTDELDDDDWYKIATHQNLSEQFIEVHAGDQLPWSQICSCQTLSDKFIEDHIDEVDWEKLSWYQNLSEEFIEKHADRVYWGAICAQNQLSEEFLERNVDRLCWAVLCADQDLSEAFMDKHADKLDWVVVSRYQKMSDEFIEKHRDRFISEACLGALSLNKKLSEGFSDSKLWKSMWKEHCDKNKPKEKIGYKVRCPKPVIVFLVGLLFVCSSVAMAYKGHFTGWFTTITVVVFALTFCLGVLCGKVDS